MNKHIRALMLCLLMVISLFSMAACKQDEGDGDSTPSGNLVYQVTVVNGVGKPYTSGMIVTFTGADGKEYLATVNASGVASKELAAGDYSVKVASTDSAELYFDSAAQVTAKAPKMELQVAYKMGEKFETIFAESVTMEGQLSYDAYNVNVGSTYVSVNSEDRNYFLFSPTEAGKYEFSVSGNSAEVGIYGASIHYIMSSSTYEVVDGKVSVNINASMIGSGAAGTTILVIGLDAKEGTDGCVLNINRVGDTDWTVEQEPWFTYQAKEKIEKFTLAQGIKLKEFDLTAASDAYQLVYNDQDGYYHLNAADGPLVYAQLGEAVYGISLMTMVGEIVYGEDGTLMQTGTAPFRYMYSNGPDDFFKEDYTDVLREYVTARDKATGVYPLTEDLYYMLPLGVEQIGWCRSDTANYLFGTEENVNNDIAWMFLLMYEDAPVPNPNPNPDPNPDPDPNPNPDPNPDPDPNPNPNPDPIEDNKDEPIMIGGTLEFNAEVKANHIVYYDLMKVNDLTLTIKSKDAYVIYNGKTFEAVNGVVTVPNLYSQYTNMPVNIAIGNKGTSDATFAVKMTYPAGHRENPYVFELGSTTTNTAAGNEVGVFYTWTATKSGTLTINIDNVSTKFGAGVTITRIVDGIPQTTEMEDGATSVSMEVKAGDMIEIVIAANPNSKHQYPAATIKTTATIA